MTGGGEGLPVSPALFFALFAVCFPFFWLAIIGVIANLGWRRVARAYPATSDPPYSARRWRFVSLSLGGLLGSPNYGSSVLAWTSDAGFWLRPLLIFRAFHPTIYVPWAQVVSIERERMLLSSRARVKLAGDVPDILFAGALARALLDRPQDKSRRRKD